MRLFKNIDDILLLGKLSKSISLTQAKMRQRANQMAQPSESHQPYLLHDVVPVLYAAGVFRCLCCVVSFLFLLWLAVSAVVVSPVSACDLDTIFFDLCDATRRDASSQQQQQQTSVRVMMNGCGVYVQTPGTGTGSTVYYYVCN